MRRPLVILALLVGAGCVEPSQPVGDLERPPDPTFAFDAPLGLGAGSSGENFAAVAHDGRILVCGHGTFTAPTPLWVVDGASSRLQDHGALVPAGDCDVDVAADGTWFVTDVWLVGVTITRSADGVTWQRSPDVAPPVTGTVDRPWLGFVGDRVLVTYQGAPQVPPHIVALVTSDDGGATWSLPRTLIESAGDLPVLHNYDFETGADGSVWTGIIEYDPGDTTRSPGVPARFSFLRSDDQGETWQSVPVLADATSDTIVGTAVAGQHLYWAYAERTGQGDTLWLLHSADEGTTWDAPRQLAADERIFTPALAGGHDGSVTVAWVQEGVERGGFAARYDPGNDTLHHAMFQAPHAASQLVEYMDVVYDLEGRATIAYSWAPDGQDCLDPRYAGGVLKLCAFIARESSSAPL